MTVEVLSTDDDALLEAGTASDAESPFEVTFDWMLGPGARLVAAGSAVIHG
jgi:hypothetical protein